VQDHALQGDAAIGAYSAVFHVVDTGGLLALLSLMSKVVRNKEAALEKHSAVQMSNPPACPPDPDVDAQSEIKRLREENKQLRASLDAALQAASKVGAVPSVSV